MTEKDKIVNFYDKLGIKDSALPKTWKKTQRSISVILSVLGGPVVQNLTVF
jgi:hypothetical protein